VSKHGQYVLLSVKDTGDGIPDNISEKMFEPFYTTKEKGKGTGLGVVSGSWYCKKVWRCHCADHSVWYRI
jgi:C4-dicarboxylate-specific signal transduction histidine kinase